MRFRIESTDPFDLLQVLDCEGVKSQALNPRLFMSVLVMGIYGVVYDIVLEAINDHDDNQIYSSSVDALIDYFDEWKIQMEKKISKETEVVF